MDWEDFRRKAADPAVCVPLRHAVGTLAQMRVLRCAPAPSPPWPHPPAHCTPSLGGLRAAQRIPFTGRFTAPTAPWRPSGPRRSATDGVYYASINMKNASNPQQYSMGNASLQGSASQDHPSDGSGDRGRSEHLRIKSNAPGFSHPAGRQRGHCCQGCPQMEHAVGAADRASGVLPLLRQDPPQGAGDDGVLSRFLQSVRLRVYFLLPFIPFLCYTGAIPRNTAEVLPFSAGKS